MYEVVTRIKFAGKVYEAGDTLNFPEGPEVEMLCKMDVLRAVKAAKAAPDTEKPKK